MKFLATQFTLQKMQSIRHKKRKLKELFRFYNFYVYFWYFLFLFVDDSGESYHHNVNVHRRKTDLMPTIPSPRDSSRSSFGTHTPRTPGSILFKLKNYSKIQFQESFIFFFTFLEHNF